MHDGAAPFSLTLDTHDPDAMVAFYRDRLGFELVETIGAGLTYERRRLFSSRHGVEIVLRNCLPRPSIGSVPGSILELGFLVDDPEAAASGLFVERREPEEGRAEVIVVHDPTHYVVVFRRARS